MSRWKKPGKPSVTKGPALHSVTLHGGPLNGQRVKHRGGDGRTLTITLHGQVGRYEQNEWRQANG